MSFKTKRNSTAENYIANLQNDLNIVVGEIAILFFINISTTSIKLNK